MIDISTPAVYRPRIPSEVFDVSGDGIELGASGPHLTFDKIDVPRTR